MSNVIGITEKGYGPTTSIGVIIQARMTSKRFPGKSMHMLDGKPVLQHVIERCQLIRGPEKVKTPIKVVVAVPDTPESEPLLQLAARMGVENFCGSEDNVLERYFAAAKHFKFNIIMRITADCPLIDPTVCSEVLQLLMWRKADYVSNCHEERSFPKGLDCECFTFDCLEMAWFETTQDYKHWSQIVKEKEDGTYHKLIPVENNLKSAKYRMEHVTPWMIQNKYVKRALLKCMAGNFSEQNWCVDYPEDIERVENIIRNGKDAIKKHGVFHITASNDNAK